MERRNPLVAPTDEGLPRSRAEPLEICVTRGQATESRHRVHAVVLKSGGSIEESWGDLSLSFFPRSAIKLIQAVPLVQRKLHEKYELSGADLALACASHSGQKFHTERVANWLKKLSLPETALECGAHAPYHDETFFALLRSGGTPCPLHNNCSGKHCGLLSLALDLGAPVAGYSNYDHPVQKEIKKIQEAFFGTRLEKWGIDGCGIPTYSLSLMAMARGMNAIANPQDLGEGISSAVKLLEKSIIENPLYVGGDDSFCSQVVRESKGSVIAKVGAEGVYGAWIPGKGISIAMKCEDGNSRAVEVALSSVLLKLGFSIAPTTKDVIRWTKEKVGRIYCRV